MNILSIIFQIIIAVGIFNVWIIRYSKQTKWRGAVAGNLKEEFAMYGLPRWFMVLVGSTKIILALILIGGIWFPLLVNPAASLMSVLMLGAIVMHLKIKDPIIKATPALIMLLLSLGVVFLSYY